MEEILKNLGKILDLIKQASKFQKSVVAIYIVIIFTTAIVAYIPDIISLVSVDAKTSKLVYSRNWEWLHISISSLIFVLLLLYLYSSKKNNNEYEKGTYVIYSPESFAQELDNNLFGQNREGWGQRALYVGIDGAKSWLSVSSHNDYEINKEKLRAAIGEILNHASSIETVVSLGPGDGKTDTELFSALSKGSPNKKLMKYVPIDISEGLLLMSMKRMKNERPSVIMPFGILGDFEYGWDNFSSIISGKEFSPCLFSMLGNTASNLDKGLESFFRNTWNKMNVDDYMLFDILLGSFDEKLGPYKEGEKIDPNTLFQGEGMISLYKWFIAQGAVRITQDHSVYDEKSKDLSEDIYLNRTVSTDLGYEQLHLSYKKGGVSKTIFKWRRYSENISKLENWINLTLKDCEICGKSDVVDEQGNITKFILLKKTRNGK